MSRTRSRAVAVAAVGVFALAPLVSACAAGQHPETALPTQLTEGINASVAQVSVRNVFVLGPAPGDRLPAGGSAPIYAWLVTTGASPDRLIAVEATDVATSVEIAGGGLTLPPNTLVSTNAAAVPNSTSTPTTSPTPAKPGKKTPRSPATPSTGARTPATPGAQGNAPSLILKGLRTPLQSTGTVRLIFHFLRAGALTVNVPVVPRAGSYATYSPAPYAAPIPPAGTPSGTATPQGGKSATPGAPAKPAKGKKGSPSPTA